MPKRKHNDCAALPSRSVQNIAPVASLQPRQVLPEFNTLDKLLESLVKCKRIVVVTGAGVSVSCGIPDFRSENGIYDVASRLDLGLSCAEDLFDLEFFTDNPEPFFKFAKTLYPGNYTPSPTHRFLKALESRGKLLRNFSQNIDGLEAQVGLKKYVACHGSFLTASCLSCKKKRTAEDIREEVMQQKVPRCPRCDGVMKPDITFFGEKLPASVKRAVEADHSKADLLLVFGTSLKVQPVSKILQFIPPHVPQVLVNRELIRPQRATSDGFDLHLLGDCDDVVSHLCARLEWELPPAIPQPVTPLTLPPTPPLVVPLRDGLDTPEKGSVVVEKVEGMLSTLPLPVFMPPNSYVFSSSDSEKGSHGGGSAAWAEELAGGVDGSVGGVACKGGPEDDDGSFEEIVTCDGCDEVVAQDDDVYACGQCFGFDLCGDCHKGGLNDHARRTGHSFQRIGRSSPAARALDDVAGGRGNGVG